MAPQGRKLKLKTDGNRETNTETLKNLYKATSETLINQTVEQTTAAAPKQAFFPKADHDFSMDGNSTFKDHMALPILACQSDSTPQRLQNMEQGYGIGTARTAWDEKFAELENICDSMAIVMFSLKEVLVHGRKNSAKTTELE